jgi:hypothetical protein
LHSHNFQNLAKRCLTTVIRENNVFLEIHSGKSSYVDSIRRLRTDQVGSLLRPQALLDARAAWQAGRLSEAGLSQLEDEAILSALRAQEAERSRFSPKACTRALQAGATDRYAAGQQISADWIHDRLPPKPSTLSCQTKLSVHIALQSVSLAEAVGRSPLTCRSPGRVERGAKARPPNTQLVAHYLPLEQLALSPQCVFASSGRGNPLTKEQQWRKLELVTAVARKVRNGA